MFVRRASENWRRAIVSPKTGSERGFRLRHSSAETSKQTLPPQKNSNPPPLRRRSESVAALPLHPETQTTPRSGGPNRVQYLTKYTTSISINVLPKRSCLLLHSRCSEWRALQTTVRQEENGAVRRDSGKVRLAKMERGTCWLCGRARRIGGRGRS